MVVCVRDVNPPRLAGYTTLGLGGDAERLIEVDTAADVVEAVRSVTGPLLVLAGGSNVVVADEGFAGTVVLIREGRISDCKTVAAMLWFKTLA